MSNDNGICKGAPAYWIVTSVQAKNDYTLIITFKDGKKKIYNALPLLKEAMFAPLKDIKVFLSAKADGTSVSWSDDIDIAPEHLYECSEEI